MISLKQKIMALPTREEWLGGQRFKYVKLCEVADVLNTEGDGAAVGGFSMPQSFVDRVTSSDEDEPSVMGAGYVDSIKRIAEEIVSACKAERQGDAEFTPEAMDDWAHRIMCFADYIPAHPARYGVVSEDGVIAESPAQPTKLEDAWTGEIECCDAKGFWLILADDCPFVPGQKVTITAALQENAK